VLEYSILLLQTGDALVHSVSSHGYLDVVQYLIEKRGADVNAKGNVSEFDCLIGSSSHNTLSHCSDHQRRPVSRLSTLYQ
jgi:hypothetical protein